MTSDIRVVHGDCLQVLPTLEAGSVDAIVTDPPFLQSGDVSYSYDNVGKVYEEATTVGMPWGYSLDWVDLVAALSPRHWVIFCNYATLGGLHVALERHAKVMAVFTWRKPNAPQMARPVPRMDCEFIIWAKAPKATCGRMKEFKSLVIDVPMPQAGCFSGERLTMPGSGKALHPCQKPLAVVLPFVTRILGPVATILDPYAGTGTTGVACLKAGHRAILIEEDNRYIPVIERRIKGAETPLFSGISLDV